MDMMITLTPADKALLNRMSRCPDGTIVVDTCFSLAVAARLVDAGLLTEVGASHPDAPRKVVRATALGRARMRDLWPDAAVGTLPYGHSAAEPRPAIVLHPDPPQLSRLSSFYNTALDTIVDAPDDALFWLHTTGELTGARLRYAFAVRRAHNAAKKTRGWHRHGTVVRVAGLRLWAAALRELAALQPVLMRGYRGLTGPSIELSAAQLHGADVAEALADALDTPIDRARPAARTDIEEAAGELLDRLRFLQPTDRDVDNPNSLLNALKSALWPSCGRGVQALSLLEQSPKRRCALG